MDSKDTPTEENPPMISAPKGPTSVTNWRARGATALDLPSGNTCLVRNPGMQHFLRTGVIPNSLRGIITKAISGQMKELKTEELVKEEEDLEKLFKLFDDILLEVVVEPPVKPVPVDETTGEEVPLLERDQSFIYVDEVDMDDKVFIFQFAVGGTRDLESFRRQQAARMAAVQSGEGIQLPT